MNLERIHETKENNLRFEKKLSLCGTKVEIDEINEHMKKLVNYSHIEKLRSEVIPMINEFSELIEKMTTDNDDMRDCIVNFDKTLCQKANS